MSVKIEALKKTVATYFRRKSSSYLLAESSLSFCTPKPNYELLKIYSCYANFSMGFISSSNLDDKQIDESLLQN